MQKVKHFPAQSRNAYQPFRYLQASYQGKSLPGRKTANQYRPERWTPNSHESEVENLPCYVAALLNEEIFLYFIGFPCTDWFVKIVKEELGGLCPTCGRSQRRLTFSKAFNTLGNSFQLSTIVANWFQTWCRIVASKDTVKAKVAIRMYFFFRRIFVNSDSVETFFSACFVI